MLRLKEKSKSSSLRTSRKPARRTPRSILRSLRTRASSASTSSKNSRCVKLLAVASWIRTSKVSARPLSRSSRKRLERASFIDRFLLETGCQDRLRSQFALNAFVNEVVVVSKRTDQFMVFQERHQFLNGTATLDDSAEGPQPEVTMTPGDLASVFDLVVAVAASQCQQSLENAGAGDPSVLQHRLTPAGRVTTDKRCFFQ